MKIVALSRVASARTSARKAGATAVAAPTSKTLGATIAKLARPAGPCKPTAKKPTTKPKPTKKPEPNPVTTLQRNLNTLLAKRTIQFRAGSAVITASSGRSVLNRLLKTLKRDQKSRIRIEGYTDSDGPAAVNLALSKARASAVKKYLVAHGIPAGLLTVKGFGEARPIASNATAAGKAKNRRIELKVRAA